MCQVLHHHHGWMLLHGVASLVLLSNLFFNSFSILPRLVK
jgi:hypothetical protein